MNKYDFKSLLTSLLLIVMVGCVDATPQNDEAEISWWEKSKQAMGKMWGQSTETAEDSVQAETEKPVEKKSGLFVQMWKKVTPTLNHVLNLEKEQETLPDSSWFGISKDKADSQNEINQLLDEAVEILSISHSTETRQRIRATEARNRELKQIISQHRQAKISAPISSTWQTTVADYDAKIKQLTKQIEKNHYKIDELKIQFANELADNGLSITDAQLEVLLSSVVGDDIIQSSIVYDNVKQISQQLMTLTIESGEDLDISQRYYGMYTVLLKTLVHMQQKFINNIDEKYLPKITTIEADVQDVNAITRNLLRGERDKNRRQHLSANLEAQNLTLKTSRLYKKHLRGQRRKVVIAMEKTTADLQIAHNTYKTVSVSGELINLLRTSQKSFELLLNIQVPDLLVFQNLQMKQEFAILTQKLAKE